MRTLENTWAWMQLSEQQKECLLNAIATERQHQAKLEAELFAKSLALESFKQVEILNDQQLTQAEAKVADYRKEMELAVENVMLLEKQLAQLQEENRRIKLSKAVLESAVLGANQMHQDYDKEIAQLKEENARLKGEAEVRAFISKDRFDEIAKLQLEVGRKDEALRYYAEFFNGKSGSYREEDMKLKPEFFIANLPQVASEALSQPTPPLYSAVVELVEALDPADVLDIKAKFKLDTLKKLMGREG